MLDRKTPRAAGFSLLELLGVIAILGVLIGLLIPAVFQLRAAAKRTASADNLSQLVIAMHNAETLHKSMPCVGFWPMDPGPTDPNPGAERASVFYHLLPYLGHQDVWKKAFRNSFELQDYPTPLVFRNPADPSFIAPDGLYEGWCANGGYAINLAALGHNIGQQWRPGFKRRARLHESFADGTSNTIVLYERYANIVNKNNPADICWNCTRNPWASAEVGQFFATLALDANMMRLTPQGNPPPFAGEADYRRAQGGHSGGVQVAMADGSVHFVATSISAATWYAAQTPDSADVLGTDWE